MTAAVLHPPEEVLLGFARALRAAGVNVTADRERTYLEAVAAVVVAKPGATVTEDELLAHARERLAGYKAPKYVALVASLPKNPSGKILKRDLRDEFHDLANR